MKTGNKVITKFGISPVVIGIVESIENRVVCNEFDCKKKQFAKIDDALIPVEELETIG